MIMNACGYETREFHYLKHVTRFAFIAVPVRRLTVNMFEEVLLDSYFLSFGMNS